MSYKQNQPPVVIFVHGSTATGKSEIALEAAKAFGGEIINCDSVQVYKEVSIGTAKPSSSDFKLVKHHLFDFIPAGEPYTAGEYHREALQVIHERFKKGVSIFYVVGGSGFYAQALLKGLYPSGSGSVQIRQTLDEELKNHGLGFLFSELEKRDFESARKIGPNDQYRILRALEILREGKFKSMREVKEHFQSIIPPFTVHKIGLKRRKPALRISVEERTKKMLREGLVEEVRGLASRGFSEWGPMNSVGYKETQAYLQGEIDQSTLADLIVQNTLRLAKKQGTWFRRDEGIIWFDPDHSRHAPLYYIHQLVLKYLKG